MSAKTLSRGSKFAGGCEFCKILQNGNIASQSTADYDHISKLKLFAFLLHNNISQNIST
jgi:hypothetical protein